MSKMAWLLLFLFCSVSYGQTESKYMNSRTGATPGQIWVVDTNANSSTGMSRWAKASGYTVSSVVAEAVASVVPSGGLWAVLGPNIIGVNPTPTLFSVGLWAFADDWSLVAVTNTRLDSFWVTNGTTLSLRSDLP